ncbi:Hsp20/alpha crystallin family protein [Legionella israelensis]|uniref:Hsp20/alpha crystallin family protein n=1 Tax=Legionella israelensis TaxID=454 RepID=A0AAX1EDP8_9GAMM|nr:Hsp20/alpha crystallin family protein [Legionella israelensis]QBR82974.1 Hsp20/alpha crystallin family protein [Legionella israelensis]
MNIIRRSPFNWPRELSAFFDQYYHPFEDDSSNIETSLWSPAVDIKEETDKFIVKADVPGVKKEDIQVSLENNMLTIKGERELEKTEENKGYTRMERLQGKFHRRFSLPDTADSNNIEAKCKNGVLEITIPKKEASKPKTIKVKVED